MSERNFSIGDAVVCVDASGGLYTGAPTGLVRGRLYTVSDAGLTDAVRWPVAGRPYVALSEHSAGGLFECGFGSWRFKFAYKPDPEVSREYTETPVKLKEPAQ